MTEPDFIAALKALASDPAARNLDDDAAVLELGGEMLILTHDTLVQGVHVREDEDPADIAWKLVAVNLSDLAAKGAKPLGVLVSHMLGDGDARFVEGLGEILREYDVPLLGGDTVSAQGRRVWGCTAIGRATHTPVPARSGARPGDAVFIGGPIGHAMLGMDAVEKRAGPYHLAYTRPRPQLTLGQTLAPHVSAMMDVSDGLLLDASRIAAASSCSIDLSHDAVAKVAPEGWAGDAMRWGDDYVLLATGPADLAARFDIHRIGTVLPEGEHEVLLDGEAAKRPYGYTH